MAVNGHTSRKLTVREAAFIGVGAMVGAGSFSLLGAAGEVAGAAVWLSFLIAGAIALLQGYSTGTPACRARVSTVSCAKPRYSMPSKVRPSTRSVSFMDSLWPIWDPLGSR